MFAVVDCDYPSLLAKRGKIWLTVARPIEQHLLLSYKLSLATKRSFRMSLIWRLSGLFLTIVRFS